MQSYSPGPTALSTAHDASLLTAVRGANSVHRGFAGALHVLIVEDDPSVRQVCAEIAGSDGCEVTTADSVASASLLLQQRAVDLVFLDLRLPGGSGTLLFQQIREKQPRAQVVIMTAYATVGSAVDFMRNGACDLLQKPFALEQIRAILTRAREQRQRSASSRVLEDRLSAGVGAGRIVGASPVMEKVFRIISKVALTRHPVLIQGEPGTGKELVARTIHGSRPEAAAPFVPVDCNSLAPELLEREIFGAADETTFVAAPRRPGALVNAGAGTIYLDDIDALAPPLQLKLLRALETKHAIPAGGGAGLRFESRILASSSRDLQPMVETGRFRKDLFYRLNIVNVRVPPLRERAGDVALLAAHFLERQRRELDIRFVLSEEVVEWMTSYHWAGNVRELENVIERVCALCSGPVIGFADLSTQLQAYATATAQPEPGMEDSAADCPLVETMEESERKIILQALKAFHGDKVAAAKALGIGKTTLYRKVKDYAIGDEAG